MRFNKIKQSLLATAIALSLSTGTSYADTIVYPNALPTDGNVIAGDITGLTGGNAVAGTPITLTGGSGIIDWNAFNVGNKATLEFVLNNGALLNRVTGNDVSFILGKINADSGTLLISNPNGILVGGGAVINANDLVLTTMNIGTEDFTKLVNGENITLNGGNVPFYVEEGAQLNIKEMLQMFGGCVNVADNVTISAKKVDLAAADKIEINKNGFVDYNYYDNNKNNLLSIGSATIGTDDKKVENVNLYGRNVELKGTKINSAGDVMVKSHKADIDGVTLKSDKEVGIFAAANSWKEEEGKVTAWESKANTIGIKNSTVESGTAMSIRGGVVDIDKSKFIAADGDIVVSAAFSARNTSHEAMGIHGKYDFSSKNTVSINESSLSNKDTNEINILGGSVDVKGEGSITSGKINIGALRILAGEQPIIAHNTNAAETPEDVGSANVDTEKVTIKGTLNVVDKHTEAEGLHHWGAWKDAASEDEPTIAPAAKPAYDPNPPIPDDATPEKVLELEPSVTAFEKHLEKQEGSKMNTAEGMLKAIEENEKLSNDQKADYVVATIKFAADEPKDTAGVGKLLSVVGSAPLSAQQKAECIEVIKTNDVVKDVTLTGKDKLVEGSGDVSTAAVTAAAPAAPAVSSEAEGDPVSVN